MREFKDIIYNEAGQRLDIFLPDENVFSVVIHFHGGGIEEGDKNEIATFKEFLAQNGIGIISAEYRLYPKALFPEFIEDAAAAVDWVYNNISNYGRCEKFYISGISAGAYIAQMLCFDKKYLAKYGINSCSIDGFLFFSGQPTAHFNVLREREIDTRRVIIDETAPLYFVGMEEKYPPMLLVVSENDIPNRIEQTYLLKSTLKYFGHEDVTLRIMKGGHCEYLYRFNENNINLAGKMIYDFVKEKEKKVNV